jgi:sugar O-acyltransferase (sialic acid O-acetyltransferase NeuD family)
MASSPQGDGSIFIFGAGGHAASVANVAMAAGYRITTFIDNGRRMATFLGTTVVETVDQAIAIGPTSCCAVAVGDNFLRERIIREVLSEYRQLRFPSLIHPSAIVSHFTTIGEGTLIMPNAVVGPNSRIGSFCILNTQASIDHDCIMDDFSSLAPGVVTGGTVKIGARAAVSIGAVIKHGVTVGRDSIVGANSYLNKDIGDHIVAYGTPAKPVRSRLTGESYLN